MGRVKAIWVSCVFQTRPTCFAHKKVRAKNVQVDMATTQTLLICVLCDVHFLGQVQITMRNIPGGILDSVF